MIQGLESRTGRQMDLRRKVKRRNPFLIHVRDLLSRLEFFGSFPIFMEFNVMFSPK